MSELAKVIAPEEMQEELEEQQEERPAFTVDSDAKAEWCMEKISQLKADLAKWEAHYAGLLESVTKGIRSNLDYFEGLLNGYFLRQQEAGFTKATKTQSSYALPSGKLVLKHQEPTYDRKTEELVPWLKANHPELVKVKEEEDWKELKKLLVVSGTTMVTEDAEIVPGITVTPRPDVFKVEVK